uniref:Uncharacterized protein n=1 Tax=viral metagenome TaxID=1070528 RepID=A0A6H2A4D6_9ZZZZ
MQKIIDFLSGKKSYILLFIGVVFNLGVLQGWWAVDNTTWVSIDTLLVALLGGSYRAAITKSSPN